MQAWTAIYYGARGQGEDECASLEEAALLLDVGEELRLFDGIGIRYPDGVVRKLEDDDLSFAQWLGLRV